MASPSGPIILYYYATMKMFNHMRYNIFVIAENFTFLRYDLRRILDFH